LLVACGPKTQWTATYIVQGQEYPTAGDGTDCPQNTDVKVGKTGTTVTSDGKVVFGASVYMVGNLKAGTCQVVTK